MTDVATTLPISTATAKALERELFGHVIDGQTVPSLDGATMPVIDPASGELVGMITELDMIEREAEFDAPIYTTFLDALFVIEGKDSEEKLARILATRAEQLMERTVYSIREDASVEEVASLMFDRKVNPVPVMSKAGEVIGIVSRSDIVRLMARDFTEPDGEETEVSSEQ